jgi:hypothetical protein
MKNRITLLIIAITLFAAVPSNAAFNLKNNTSPEIFGNKKNPKKKVKR